jgi:hypothetical protein
MRDKWTNRIMLIKYFFEHIGHLSFSYHFKKLQVFKQTVAVELVIYYYVHVVSVS